MLLGDFCCDWSLKIKSGTPVINIEAYTAIYRQACILQPYFFSFQATISRQFFPPIPVQPLVCDLCAVCVLSGNEVIGVDSAEVRVSVQYLHIIDNQQTLFELSHKLEPRAWTHQRTQRKTSHILLQDHRTSRGDHWIVRWQIFWKYHTETFKQTFLLWKKFYIKRGLAKLGAEEAVSIL